MVRTGPGWMQRGPQAFELFFSAFPGTLAKIWIGNGSIGLKIASFGDTSIAGGGLTWYNYYYGYYF